MPPPDNLPPANERQEVFERFVCSELLTAAAERRHLNKWMHSSIAVQHALSAELCDCRSAVLRVFNTVQTLNTAVTNITNNVTNITNYLGGPGGPGGGFGGPGGDGAGGGPNLPVQLDCILAKLAVLYDSTNALRSTTNETREDVAAVSNAAHGAVATLASQVHSALTDTVNSVETALRASFIGPLEDAAARSEANTANLQTIADALQVYKVTLDRVVQHAAACTVCTDDVCSTPGTPPMCTPHNASSE